MINIIKKLCKLAKINYYEGATKMIQSPIYECGLCSGVKSENLCENIFSREKLIDDKYFYIRNCEINELNPEYRVRFINILSEDYVKSCLLSVVPKKIKSKFKELDIKSYKLKDRFIHVANVKLYSGESSSYREVGDDYMNSKLTLLYNIVKFLDRVKYERNRRSKIQKELHGDIHK